MSITESLIGQKKEMREKKTGFVHFIIHVIQQYRKFSFTLHHGISLCLTRTCIKKHKNKQIFENLVLQQSIVNFNNNNILP